MFRASTWREGKEWMRWMRPADTVGCWQKVETAKKRNSSGRKILAGIFFKRQNVYRKVKPNVMVFRLLESGFQPEGLFHPLQKRLHHVCPRVQIARLHGDSFRFSNRRKLMICSDFSIALFFSFTKMTEFFENIVLSRLNVAIDLLSMCKSQVRSQDFPLCSINVF